jgi:putative drug exporter of the RND superfamily
VLILVGVTAASTAVGSDYHNDFSLPGTESQRALDTLRAHASTRAGDTVQVVVHDPDGLRDTKVRQRLESMLDEVRGLPHVADVRSPYVDGSLVSRDGTIGYAPVTLDGRAEDVPTADVRRIIDTAKEAQGGGLRVEVGGDAARSAEEAGGGPAEGVGLLGALVVLVLLFGSLVAASLPIVMAVFAVGSTVGLIALASHLADVADFTPPVMVLVGLGVGIDYALLIFSRYRSELVAGAEPERAARTALDTARTVFFASCTVVIAMLGLVALGLGSFRGLALSVTLTVLTTMVASLTLLPALLAVFGRRIQRAVARRAGRARRADGERWRRWAAGVQRRPWLALLVPVAALLALSAPALGLRLGFSDAGTDPTSKTSRQAYDLLARGFGPGFNGPLLVVVQGDGRQPVDQRDVGAVRDALAAAPGVAAAVPLPPERDGNVATVIAFPESAPQDRATADLVDRLRTDVLPPLERRTGTTLLVGGSTAAVVDFADTVSDRLPLFVAIVVGLSALLLMVVFRSLLVPLKAALLNLLSIGAALGVMTFVFQNGALGAEAGRSRRSSR